MSMKRLRERVRDDAGFELELTRRIYEPHFTSHAQAREVLLEEIRETEDELFSVRRQAREIEDGHADANLLQNLEGSLINTACEAIQAAAMCRKWIQSLEQMKPNER